MTTQARTALGGTLSKRMAAVTAAAVLATSGGLAAAAQAAPAAATGTYASANELTTAVVRGGSGTTLAQIGQQVRAAGGEVTDELPLVNGVIARLPAGADLPGLQTTADAPLKVASDSTDQAGSDAASTIRATMGLPAQGNEGSGVTVALVDTGVADVPDLAGKIVDHVNVTGGRDGDGYGHGTFLAGLIAGSGQASNGAYQGAAPGARILDVRVAGKDGSTSLARVLTGLQRVAALGSGKVQVVNLALSSDSPLPAQIDPLNNALETLWMMGFTVVVPSGNDGDQGVGSPGVDPTLLTAGALDEQGTADRTDDRVADFSGYDPSGATKKPDLVAPGTHVIGLRAPGSVVDTTYPNSRVGTDYFRGSGTSMSTALTSAAAADVLGTRSELTPDAVKALLIGSAYSAGGLADPTSAGAGGLDVAAAMDAAPTADNTSAPDDLLPPGDAKTWDRFADAMLRGNLTKAAKLWDKLSPESRRWVQVQWSKLSPESRRWVADSWTSRRWVATDASLDDWQSRFWASRRWVSRRWAADSWNSRRWVAQNWMSRRWVDDDWASRRWVSDDWASRRWVDSVWESRRWVAVWG
ncbi:MAG: S8 family serine peptidase [Frankiaceae bacterium]